MDRNYREKWHRRIQELMDAAWEQWGEMDTDDYLRACRKLADLQDAMVNEMVELEMALDDLDAEIGERA